MKISTIKELRKIKSIRELILTFNTEEKCIDFLEQIIWKGKLVSPFDKTAKIYKCGNRYKCNKTGKYFNVKHNTFMHGSKVSTLNWIIAIWFYVTHKGGLSSMQLHRELDLTQKTTWLMLHKIRNCSKFENMHKMKGIVEADETYVGGKNPNRHYNKKVKNAQGRSCIDKVPVFGLVERGGKVMARVVSSVKAEVLQPIISRTVDLFSTIYTDEWGAYNGLGLFFDHAIVNHGRKQYVNGDVHTNTIENFWGNVKRGIIGVYRVTSRKRLQLYLNEFVFKYNTRKNKPIENLIHLLSNSKGSKKTYRELMA